MVMTARHMKFAPPFMEPQSGEQMQHDSDPVSPNAIKNNQTSLLGSARHAIRNREP
jgi:hypothetical protein